MASASVMAPSTRLLRSRRKLCSFNGSCPIRVWVSYSMGQPIPGAFVNDSIISASALAISLLGLLLAFTAHKRISKARKSLVLLQGTHDGKTIIDALASYARELGSIDAAIQELASRQQELFASLGLSKRNLGVVRYDAFEDMGGRLSFSLALVDDHANGVVMTSINGRAESRVYAKVLEAGASEHNLSVEEERAIADALGTKQKVRR